MTAPAAGCLPPSPAPYRGRPAELAVCAGGGAMAKAARVLDGVNWLSLWAGGGGIENAAGLPNGGIGGTPDRCVRELELLLKVATDELEYALCAFHPLTAAAGVVKDDVAVDGIKAAKPLRF